HLPNCVGVTAHKSYLFILKLFIGRIVKPLACAFVFNYKRRYPCSRTKHHAPTHLVAFFCPKNIAFDEVMSDREKDLHNKKRNKKITEKRPVFIRIPFRNIYRFLT